MRHRSRFAAVAAGFALAACGGTSTPATDGEAVPLSSAAEDPGADTVRIADAGAGAAARLERPTPPARLEIALGGVEALSLVELVAPGQKRGQGTVQLVGKVTVSITNPSQTPVRLVHMNPANLVFTRVDSGARFSILHPCDPGLLLVSMGGPVQVPRDGELRTEGNTVFTLGPGEARTFEMGDDWGCSGGPWQPVPAPGEHRVEYRIHRLADAWIGPELPAGGSIREKLEAARSALAGDAFWEGAYRSAPVAITFGEPRVQRIER